MTLRHFKIFLAVCKEKNMTKAAEQLFITQPSITQAIKEIEEHYKTLLFERIGKRINITADGYKLIPIAKNIIDLFENAETTMKDNNSIKKLNIGASVTIGTYLFPKALGLMNKYPNIEIYSKIDNTKNIEKMILDFEVDFAIVEGNIHSKNIKTFPLIEDELIFVCSPDNILSKKESLNIDEIAKSKFILRESGSGTKEIIESFLHSNNIDIEIIGSVSSIEAIKNMVSENIGVSILPKISVINEIAKNQIKHCKIKEMNLIRNFKLAYHKDKQDCKYREIFAEIIKNINK